MRNLARKLLFPAFAAALALAPVAFAPAAGSGLPPGAPGCHVSVWRASGTVSLRQFLRRHVTHAGLPGVLATSYTCGHGWTRDWSGYLARENLNSLMPRGMRVWYVGPGPRY